MTSPNPNRPNANPLEEAIASLADAVQTATATFNRTATAIEDAIIPVVQPAIEQGTETIGRLVAPIADNPIVQFATRVPGLNWLMAAIGQVNVDKVQQEVTALRQQYPLETDEQLAHRIIVETAVRAGGIGLLTNFVPPLALALFAIDIAAVTALQAEMTYRIAAIYGFSLKDATRRGEVLAIWALSTGGSGVLKGGLSVVELLPLVGTVVGLTSDAALIYSLGRIASRFYEVKQRSTRQPSEFNSTARPSEIDIE